MGQSLIVIFAVAELLGFLSAIHAVMSTRTAQGAIAWAVSLIAFPYLAVPAYWVFGRRKFEGYLESRRGNEEAIDRLVNEVRDNLKDAMVEAEERLPNYEGLKALAGSGFTRYNEVQLLVDGEATFESIFAGIDRAKDYVLIEFYIVHADGLGRRLAQKLIEKASQGVRVYFLYDELGSMKLPAGYINDMRHAGVEVSAFNTTQGRRNRFQLNFRNHRKIVVIDGREAWVGGHNVGDEYLGLDPKVGAWRDTHVRLAGPVVVGAQAAFAADWYWATRSLPELNWQPGRATDSDALALILATSPADRLETAQLFFVHALNSAQDRIWIATPYFVPDSAVIAALQLAALRGVDVRILIPEKNDNWMVQMSSFWYLEELDGVPIEFYRYQPGFMHQKVMLVDDRVATVGTANFDNRSFRLNFEVTAVIANDEFSAEIEKMLEADFARSRPTDLAELKQKPFWFRLAVRVARLTAPLQ